MRNEIMRLNQLLIDIENKAYDFHGEIRELKENK